MRSRKLVKNTITALILQIVTIVCGFIVPRLILSFYGSETNGLVNSISQFIAIISFMDMGVGAVFQSSLYKPLADNDNIEISKLYSAGRKFYNHLGVILVFYVIILIIVYPRFAGENFGYGFTATLIAVISISAFAQYFFGMTNGLFITADQRGYVQYLIQIVTIILNTILCYFLIYLKVSIHLLKLVSSLIFLLRPVFLEFYIRHHYQIDRKISYTSEPIQQKWNGLAQHVASVVLESTDTIILTLFSTLVDVSIYSVYYLVVGNIKNLFTVMTNGIQALIGNLYANGEETKLRDVFGWTEWVIHTTATLVFGCTVSLIIPFVLVYTTGINDANYNQPLFSMLICLAFLVYTYRLPYHIAIKAGVHYKQTQLCYIIAVVLNVTISILMVYKLGIVGVAIGTLIAMLYQTIWMAYYISKNIIYWPLKKFLKQLIIDVFIFVCGTFITHWLSLEKLTFISWILLAIKTSLIWLLLCVIINFIFYKDRMIQLLDKFWHRKGKIKLK